MRDTPARARDSSPSPLAGLAPDDFLRRYWQKRARLVRAALPGFRGVAGREELFALAQRDDVESRLVVREGRSFRVTPGPLSRRDLARLPPRDWTLLVHGVNLHSREGDALLRRFAFIPFARLDDLMVSYAAEGGGVGPHIDSYDVFLLQGSGRRRWRWGAQRDLTLRPRMPLSILRRFAPTAEAVLGPGDMLYLPPSIAHDGVALEPCTTCSIGFRAPAATELAIAFLDHLRDRLELPGRYADPDLRSTREPAHIGTAMVAQCERMLSGIAWDRRGVARFLGAWLTEPKPTVVFARPSPSLSRTAFAARARRHGLRLDSRSLLLYDATAIYANGEPAPRPRRDATLLMRLANARGLAAADAARLSPEAIALLHLWYRHGYLHPTA